MNAGLLLHFLSLIKKITVFFSTYDNTTEGIKKRLEQIYYMIYCPVQYVLAIGIKGDKIEDQAPFYQGDLVKQKMKSTLKVSGVMINARAVTIDSVYIKKTVSKSLKYDIYL